MKKIALSVLVAATVAMADCSYSKSGDVSVNWTAFKTPMKKGVGGTFRSIVYKGTEKGASLTQLLKGAKVMIQTNNVDSGNTGRDAKLVQFFFNQMDGQMLEAQILDMDEEAKVVLVEVIMNGKGLNVPMAYSYEKGVFTAGGVIDLGDFKALDALTSINRACYDLHAGKTWQDVNIGFSMNVEESCTK
ncbi:YceI family protein [Sulfurimonas sp. HSL-3221]|uniref:YceI family protein n=1 Tax=Sulfurimonadaceae TaxID=2771471 RepID=UPI001E58A988|nr:YceI family protein [Sulfurimonas sp. HSL-3221]UFS63558.1 YceI family protein [Sulfurimonas sp. HSL-3221]